MDQGRTRARQGQEIGLCFNTWLKNVGLSTTSEGKYNEYKNNRACRRLVSVTMPDVMRDVLWKRQNNNKNYVNKEGQTQNANDGHWSILRGEKDVKSGGNTLRCLMMWKTRGKTLKR